MKKIKSIFVDDEPPAIELLDKYATLLPGLEVVERFGNAIKAFEYLAENKVDLMFLDIRMPVLNGIDFLKSIQKPPAVIITTAYREYAIEGYDLDIIDYLLKPIAFDRFMKAVDRYRERASTEGNTSEFIYVNVNRTHHKIHLSDIQFVESLKDYVRVHTLQGNHVVKGNIGSFMKRLPSKSFIRIHRSYAISLAHLSAYNQSEVVVNGVKIPIGIKYKKALPFI